ncbi:UDP binding domain-containing protein [Microbacterium sp. NPDC077391]|uniref:UDP binding domain-containing protein n=1 Tax=Microbacterium sp. NPDC077391 TaxID=3154765 RepID=UPI00343E0E9F
MYAALRSASGTCPTTSPAVSSKPEASDLSYTLSCDEPDILREAYHPALTKGTPFIVADLGTAELLNVSANAFLATTVPFINAMAEVVGAEVTELADAIGLDARIGRRFLGAGIGFVGGCMPKDIRAFAARAEALGRGESVSFLREVDAINLRRRDRAVHLAVDALAGNVVDKRVAVLCAAFKPHSDDIRDPPRCGRAPDRPRRRRHRHRHRHRPRALENARRQHPQLTYVEDRDDALRGAEAVIVVTEWDEYRRGLPPEHAASLVAGKVIVDGCNCLNAVEWREAGWTYHGMGRP